MLSSTEIFHLSQEFGDIVLSCPVHISRSIHNQECECVLQYTSALLNSGGGILMMHNEDYNKGSQSKTLDAWWSGMEHNMSTILSDDICNYLDFVGNFDDQYFFLFVKSAEHVCTVKFHTRLPTDTATHCVTYKSAVKICSTQGYSRPLSDLPAIPSEFIYGRTEVTLKQEGKQIQFKLLTSRYRRETLADKVSHYSTKYISAFANHEGGHIYFGIADSTAAVMGEEMTETDEVRIVHLIESKMNSMIWGDTAFSPQRGVHWDIQFFPVLRCPRLERRMVIVVSICKMYGGVFTKCPEAYIISETMTDGDSLSNFSVVRLSFDEWKKELLNQSRDTKAMHSRFVKIPLRTPQSRLVYSLPHTVQATREKIVKLNTGFNLHPKNLLQSFADENVSGAIRNLINTFIGEPHLIISLESWGLQLNLAQKPPCIKASLAIFSSLYGLHVVSLVANPLSGGELWSYTQHVAIHLKQVLVQHGGCNSHMGFKTHIVDIHAPFMLEYFQSSIDKDVYPQTYRLREENFDAILTSLTIAMSSFLPVSDDSCEANHYFLLTCDQLELLWTHQFTRELWIHGPPGSGKTVAALELIRELRSRGCDVNEILYVAENPLLCSYVSSFGLSLVVGRRELMVDASAQQNLLQKYSNVKNVIVDEAQNFKDRDGDWYSLLDKLSNQHHTNPFDWTAGYFWVFMDYVQKVHRFKTGLPGLIGKNNFVLREISRNSKEIFEYASKFMEKPNTALPGASVDGLMSDSPYLGHDFKSGNDVTILKCENSNMQNTLSRVLKQFREDGVNVEDMAILVSKKKEVEEVKKSVESDSIVMEEPQTVTIPQSEAGHSEAASIGCGSGNVVSSSLISKDASRGTIPSYEGGEIQRDGQHAKTNSELSRPSSNHSISSTNPPLVSTVRNFSGLDKSVIIGLEPHINQDHADFDKFLVNLATRAKDSLVILTTSDAIMDKLKLS